MEILHAAGDALFIIFTWHTLPFLFLGVAMGLCLGILPGSIPRARGIGGSVSEGFRRGGNDAAFSSNDQP